MKTFPNLILDVVKVHSMPEWLLIISPVAGFHKRGEGQFAIPLWSCSISFLCFIPQGFGTSNNVYIKLKPHSISFYLFMFLIDTPIPHKDFTPQRV